MEKVQWWWLSCKEIKWTFFKKKKKYTAEQSTQYIPSRNEKRHLNIYSPILTEALFTVAKRWKPPIKGWRDTIITMYCYLAGKVMKLWQMLQLGGNLKTFWVKAASHKTPHTDGMISFVWNVQDKKNPERESWLAVVSWWEWRMRMRSNWLVGFLSGDKKALESDKVHSCTYYECTKYHWINI